MNPDDFPAPKDGFVLTHFLVVADQVRSRDFYQKIFGGQVLIERDPVIMKVANTWLILNEGGGPTDDKPTVTLTTPPDPNRTSASPRSSPAAGPNAIPTATARFSSTTGDGASCATAS